MVPGIKKLSLSTQCIKYLLFIFNLLFVLTGVLLIFIGVGIVHVYEEYQRFLDTKYMSVPTLMICIGGVVFAIAFFGCCGAIQENYCMIVTFAALMVVVFVMELAAGISGYVMRNNAHEMLTKTMMASLNDYESKENVYKVWDAIQTRGCCGVEKPMDWINTWKINSTNKINNYLPLSCCKPGVIGECIYLNKNQTSNVKVKYYENGCLSGMTEFAKGHAMQILITGLLIACAQALGIWFAANLAAAIKRNYYGGV